MTIPVKPINEIEEKSEVGLNDKILILDADTEEARLASKDELKGDPGTPGRDGEDGAAATITVGSTTTGTPGSSASVTNSGTSSAAVLDFTIPQGEPGVDGQDGADGAAATITVGTTTTGNPGTSASVTNSGTSSAAVFNFTIPKGNTGETGNGIASITSSKSGKITTVTITETNSTVDTFQISDGADGTGSGDVIGPASSVDGDVAIFDGATGKLIKDGSVALSTLSAGASAGATAVQPGDIGTAAACNTGTSSGNVPILDSNGKLATSTLPGVALTDTFTVSTSSDLTTLSSADQGDIAIVTTENKTYVLSQAPYSTAANWKQILSPTGGVTSWNGQTGAVTYTAPVTSVNGSTGAVTVSEFSPTGTATTGYVVTKTANGYEWAAPSGGDVVVSSQTGNILTSGMKIWAGLETDYGNLGTYDSNTLYLTVE